MNLAHEKSDSIRHCRNISISNVCEKNKLREKLESDVEEFLKNGGSVNELESNATAYPNGMPHRSRSIVQATETPREVIEKRNRAIRASNEKTYSRLSAEWMPKLILFYDELQVGDKSRFIKECGLKKAAIHSARNGRRIKLEDWEAIAKTIPVFKKSEIKVIQKIKAKKKTVRVSAASDEYKRRVEMAALKKEAMDRGDKSFMAPCKHHGSTIFKFVSSTEARCSECHRSRMKKHMRLHADAESKTRNERFIANRDAMNKAIENGEKTFTGLCLTHGYSEMKISTRKSGEHDYRCIACSKKYNEKYYEGVKNESKNDA